MKTKTKNVTVIDMSIDHARDKVVEILSRNTIKEGVGAKSKVERESLSLTSTTYATPASLKKRVVDYSLPAIKLLYKRVSMKKNDSKSVTFERQLMEIKGLAKSDGVCLDDVIEFSDLGKSGFKRVHRKGLDAMVTFIDEFTGANPIIVYIYDVDRVIRNEDVASVFFKVLRKQNVDLRVVTMPIINLKDDSATNLILPILIQMAQAYSVQTAHRTTGGHEVRAEKGYWRNSLAPYGMTTIKKLMDGTERSILAPGDNADIVRDIFDRASKGDGINQIVRYLNGKNIPAPGKADIWRDTTLKFVLLNPHYAGFSRYNSKKEHKLYDVEEQIVKDENGDYLISHEGIITPETFFTVLFILKSRHKVQGKSQHIHMLSGILYCAECNAKLFGNKSGVSSYRCPDATRDEKLTANSISCAGLEEVIKRYAKYIIANPDLLKELSVQPIVVSLEEEEQARQVIINKIKDIEIRMANETIDYVMNSLKNAYADATKALEEYNSNKEINTKFATTALASPEVFEDMWSNQNKTAIIMALKTFIERIDVEPLGDRKKLNTTLLKKKGWLFDYTRVSITWSNGTTIKLSEEFDKRTNEVLYK